MKLKFRAFNKATEEMYPVRGLAASDESDFLDLVDMSLTGENAVHDYSDTDYCVVMQWTGLKDKNGVDVYEGDIVRCTSGCPHVIEWVEAHGGTYIGGMPAFYLNGLNPGYAWTGYEEVIGNVHEHPSLIGRQASDSTAILSESEAE